MKLTRRSFLAALTLAGLGCAKIKPKLGATRDSLARLTPDLSSLGFGKKGPFAFATLGDLHLTDARSTSVVARAIQQIKADDRIAFAVVLGDLASSGRIQELNLAKQILTQLEERWDALPGEHDVNAATSDPLHNYKTAIGETQWADDRFGWRFIGLATVFGEGERPTVTPEQLEWLEKEIGRAGNDQSLALLTHHPLLIAPEDYRVANAAEVLALFEGRKLRLVASGHFHANQEMIADGVLHVTTAACSRTVENDDSTRSPGYRLYHIDGETVTTEFVSIDV